MQLNQGAPGSHLQSEINITPLVDVVLVLLIIFMVVVPLLMEGYKRRHPSKFHRCRSRAIGRIAADPEYRAIGLPHFKPLAGRGVPEDCRVTLADQKIPCGRELPARVAEILGGQPPEKRVLFLSADDRLNYEGVSAHHRSGEVWASRI